MRLLKMKAFLLSIGLIAFFLMAVLGTANIGMEMYAPMHILSDTTQGAPMAGCLFTGVFHPSASCEMGPFEHIAEWQNILSVLPAPKSLSLFLALLFFALAVYVIKKAFDVLRAQSARGARFRFRARFFDYTAFDRPLQEAFSNGILHPKIF